MGNAKPKAVQEEEVQQAPQGNPTGASNQAFAARKAPSGASTGANQTSQRAGSVYLQRVHMDAFGRFADKHIGPLVPDLNVVYGANEAGKTTARAFIDGVLFGWPEARGGRNAYKPRTGQRAGSLLFCDGETGQTAAVSRMRNADGLRGDEAMAARVLGDIDRETYETLFSLDADELRSLEAATDISAKLLTAGSGTKVSPAVAAAALDAKIVAHTSRAAGATESFPNLKRQMGEVKERLQEARERADALKAEDMESRNLEMARANMVRERAETSARVEALAACKAELARIDDMTASLQQEQAQAKAELRSCQQQAESARAAAGAAPEIPVETAARLRQVVAPLAQREQALALRIQAARETYEQARGRWQAQDDAAAQHAAKPGSSRALFVAAFVAALLCAAGAVAAAVFAPSSFAISVAALGVSVALAALAIAGLGHIRRHAKKAPDVEGARAAMVAARSTLDARESDLLLIGDQLAQVLSASPVPIAAVSASDALQTLEAAERGQANQAASAATLKAARDRCAHVEAELSRLAEHRENCLAQAGLSVDAQAFDIEQLSARLAAHRATLDDDFASLNARAGELRTLLQNGERASEFDRLKTQQAEIRTRQADAAEQLACELLARRILGRAMDAWGAESQPGVYARAGELLHTMTGGAWQGVRAMGNGDVAAIDAFGTAHDPRMLSLGTCQQLYLALRIALLECVPDVGSCVPVLCDDILVNFDDERRRGAARALASLAETRQVVVFTCHKEVVSAFSQQALPAYVFTL